MDERNKEEHQDSKLTRRLLLGGPVAAALVAMADPVWAALPERRLDLVHAVTGEAFSEVYWCDGNYVEESLKRLDWLMRDFHCDEAAPVDAALLDILSEVAQRVRQRQPMVVHSGYRTRRTNQSLRKEGYAPSAASFHLEAKAVDFHLPGVGLGRLSRAARALQAGGVGTYPSENFVHLDVGPVRAW